LVETYQIFSNRYLAQFFFFFLVRKFSENRIFGEKILDVGCGRKPHAKFFKNTITYLGIDANKNSKADIIAAAEYLPFRDDSFDVVICTQVLEHMEDPKKSLIEIKRVLNEKGVLLLSTHGFWLEEHEVKDYWRWTLQGLKKLLKECNLTLHYTSSMKPTASLMQTLLFFIPQKVFFSPVIALLNILSIGLNFILKNRGPKLYSVHFIIAKHSKVGDNID